MLNHIYKVLLLCIFVLPAAQALDIGDAVPDFVMPSSNGAPQRLSEQVGNPVMLVWLGDCDSCEETLIDLQYLAESFAVEGLQTWFLWRKNLENKAPWSRLPVLEYQASNQEAWWFESAPAVMFINPDGILDYLATEDVYERKLEVTNDLKLWLENKKWFQ